jgi:hypothetical protein
MLIKIRRTFFTIVVILLLSGCVSAPPLKSAPTQNVVSDNRARIVFTRSTDFLYLALDARVSVNGQVVAALPRGESTYSDVSPGTVTISVDHPTAPGTFTISFATKAGDTYNTRISPRDFSFGAGALFGVAGLAIEASPGNGGLFRVDLVSVTENQNKQFVEKPIISKKHNTSINLQSENDYIKELERIKDLLDSEIINQDEFNTLKQKVIDRL